MLPLIEPPVTGVIVPFSIRYPRRISPPRCPENVSIWKSENVTAHRQGRAFISAKVIVPGLSQENL